MCIERKAPVQNDTEKTWRDVNPNSLIANEEGKLPSAVVGLLQTVSYALLKFIGTESCIGRC